MLSTYQPDPSDNLTNVKSRIFTVIFKHCHLVCGDRISDHILLTVYCDPRFKDFSCFPSQHNLIYQTRTLDVITNLLKSFSNELPSQREIVASDKVTTYRKLFGSLLDRTSTQNRWQDELSSYNLLEVSPILDESGKMIDILQWWKVHSSQFPSLARIARKYLSLSATSVPCERTFSKCGWILGPTRCSMKDQTFCDLAFCVCNNRYHG